MGEARRRKGGSWGVVCKWKIIVNKRKNIIFSMVRSGGGSGPDGDGREKDKSHRGRLRCLARFSVVDLNCNIIVIGAVLTR